MNVNDYFHDADVPWMPKLIDIEYLKSNDNPDFDERVYYSKFGWRELDHDTSIDPLHVSKYPNINRRWDELAVRFNERYYNRMLAYETMETWQTRLQNKFDETADKYERAYALYAEYKDDMFDDVIEGTKTVIDGTVQDSGTDSVQFNGSETDTSDRSTWDTPDSAINHNADYADTRAHDTDTRTFTNRSNDTIHGRKSDTDVTTTMIKTGANIIDNVNTSIRSWKDIDTAFIAEFENLFLNVFWY